MTVSLVKLLSLTARFLLPVQAKNMQKIGRDENSVQRERH